MINYETMKQHLLHKIAEYDKQIEECDKQIEEFGKSGDSEVAKSFNKVKVSMWQIHKHIVNEVLTWVEGHNN